MIVDVVMTPAVCINDVCPLKSNMVAVSVPPPVLVTALPPSCRFAIVSEFLTVITAFAAIVIIPVLVTVPDVWLNKLDIVVFFEPKLIVPPELLVKPPTVSGLFVATLKL